MECKFVVVYDCPSYFNTELETELKQLLTKHGWELYGEGFDVTTNERDLAFYKEVDDDDS